MDSDSLMELTELVHKGERRGIFMDDMPARIHQSIQAENLTFVKNRDVYNTEYFKFVRDLAAKNCVSTPTIHYTYVDPEIYRSDVLAIICSFLLKFCSKLKRKF